MQLNYNVYVFCLRFFLSSIFLFCDLLFFPLSILFCLLSCFLLSYLSFNFSFLQKYCHTSGETSQLLNTQWFISRSTHLQSFRVSGLFQLTSNNPTMTSTSPEEHSSIVHPFFWVQQAAPYLIHQVSPAQDHAKERSSSSYVVYTLCAPRNTSFGKLACCSKTLPQNTMLLSSLFMKECTSQCQSMPDFIV